MGGMFPGGGDGRSGDGAKAAPSSPSTSSSPPPRPTPSPVQDALAGACAGALARVCVGPLDVIKIRFQVQLEPVLGEAAALKAAGSKYRGLGQALKLIVREEGLAGLWRGTVPGLLLTVPYTSVQFVTLQAVKGAAAAKKGRGGRERAVEGGSRGGGTGASAAAEDAPSSSSSSSSSSLLSFGAGAVAGAAATVASYPFDLLRTTLAAQGEPKVYRGTLDAARGVLARSGPRGLYAGLGTTLVEIVPYAALQFGLYDGLTRAADRRAQERERQRKGAGTARNSKKAGSTSEDDVVVATADAATRFLCGLAAGTAAKLTTHPLDVAKKRYQVAGLARSSAYGARVPAAAAARPLLATLSAVAAKEGIAGLYKGALPSILKAAPQAAVTLAAYEFFAGWIASGGVFRGVSVEEEN